MSKIKIEDLPVLEELNEKQSKGIFGGGLLEPVTSRKTFNLSSFSFNLTGDFGKFDGRRGLRRDDRIGIRK